MAAWASLAACVIAVGWFQLVKAGYSGVLPSLLSEQFPVETRAIGVSLSFSIAVSIFGGLAPLVATSLIAATGGSLSPSDYLIFTALLSLVALMAIQNRSRGLVDTFCWIDGNFSASISWGRNEAAKLSLHQFGKGNRRAVLKIRPDDLNADPQSGF